MDSMQLPRGVSTVWMAKLLGITGNTVIIFNELFFLTKKGEHSYYDGIRKLAEDNCLCERTVSRGIDKLLAKNLLSKSVDRDGGICLEITEEAKKKIYGENYKATDKLSGENSGQIVTSSGQIVKDDGQIVRCEIIGSSLNSESLTKKSLKISVSQSINHNTCGSAREEYGDDGQHNGDDKLKACETKTVPEFVDWLYSNSASEKLKSDMRTLAVNNALPSWEMNAILSYSMDQSRYKGTLPPAIFIQKVIDRVSRAAKPKNPEETMELLMFGEIRKHDETSKPKEDPSEEPLEFTPEEQAMLDELDRKMGHCGRNPLFPEGRTK